MPCFVFVSGYFSKKGLTLKQIIAQYFVFVVIFQIFYYVVNWLLGNHISLKAFLFTPWHHLWYLFSLCIWVYMLNFVNLKYLKYYILAAFFVALIAGAFSFISTKFSLSRTFYFFPFFLMGFYVKQENISEVLFNTKWIKIASAVILLCAIVAIFGFHVNLPGNRLLFQGILSYKGLKIHILPGMVWRAIILVFTAVVVFLVLNSIPSGKTFFTKFGAKTLPIYIFHRVFVLLLIHFGFFKIPMEQWQLVVSALSVSAVIYYLSSFDVFNNILTSIPKKAKQLLKI